MVFGFKQQSRLRLKKPTRFLTVVIVLVVLIAFNCVAFISQTNNDVTITNRLDVPITLKSVSLISHKDPAYAKGGRGTSILSNGRELAPGASIRVPFRGLRDGVVTFQWSSYEANQNRAAQVTTDIGGRSWGNHLSYEVMPAGADHRIDYKFSTLRHAIDQIQTWLPAGINSILK